MNSTEWPEELTVAYSHDAFDRNFTCFSHNIHTKLHINGAAYIQRVGIPIVCLFGIIGNILNLLVLTRDKLRCSLDNMEKSAHTGLLALAVSDLVFCLVAFPMAFQPVQLLFTSPSFMVYYKLHHHALLNIFLMTSTWLTVLMAVGRYLAICYPFHARVLIELRTTKVIICAIFMICIAFTLPSFWQNRLILGCLPICPCYVPAKGQLFRNKSFSFIYHMIRSILAVFIPIIIMAFCNVCLIRALRHSINLQRRYGSTPALESENRLTPTLIIIILLNILLVCPSEFLKFYRDMVRTHSHRHLEQMQMASNITNFMQLVNFAMNFVLYFVINIHFRRAMKEMLVCLRGQSLLRKRSASNRHSSSSHNDMYLSDIEYC